MAEAKQVDNEDTIPYRYQVLPKRAIRLLQIPEGSIYQPWTLTAYELEECPSYISLSYTWGPPLDTEECKREYGAVKRSLTLRSKNITGSLGIGRNLWEGLEQLIAAGYTGHIWADAICINQEDEQERSFQVALMSHIFSVCQKVVVWLGKDQANLEDFSWFHEKLLPIAEKYLNEGGHVSNLMQMVTKANLSQDPSPRWRGYVSFYEQHRWFHRCWIMQEVALASEVEVFCGSASLDFEDICNFSWLLHDLATDLVPIGWKPEGTNTELAVGHKCQKIARQRDMCRSTELRSENGVDSVTGANSPLQMCFAFFLSTLSSVGGYQATDPRDKVYAALAMAMKFLPPEEEPMVVPDYSLSIVEVYQNTTKFLIQNLPSLAVLSYVEDKSFRMLPDLPSWVPDFSTPFVSTTYASRYDSYLHNACLLERYPRSIEGSELRLYGARFDTVSIVAGAMSNYRLDVRVSTETPTAHNLELCHRLIKFLSCLDAQYVNGQSRLEALSRTLILNQLDRGPPPSDAVQLFRDWLLHVLSLAAWVIRRMDKEPALLQACTASLETLEETQNGTLANEDSIDFYVRMNLSRDVTVVTRTPSGVSPDEVSSSDEEDGADEVWIGHNLYDRGLNKGLFLRQRLYKTSRGYIGLGPPSMQAGDQVCFICNSTVPFILRSAEPDALKSTLIGETYVHGFMNGEILQTDFKDRIGPIYMV